MGTSLEMATIIANVYYGHQSARISNFNRIRNLIRRKYEDLESNIPEDKKEDKYYINRYIDKNLEFLLEKIINDKGKLNEQEQNFIDEFVKIAKETKILETRCLKMMDIFLETEPIWKWLTKIKGISRVLAINLIRNFGYCESANYPSSIYKYAGLDVVEGTARRRKRGEKLTYSARAKTVSWLIADSFLKHRVEPYRNLYDTEKARLQTLKFKEGELKSKYKGYKESDTQLSKGHIHNRCMRRMSKRFLIHYLIVARKMKGLKVERTYVEEILGHTHIDKPPFTEGLFINNK